MRICGSYVFQTLMPGAAWHNCPMPGQAAMVWLPPCNGASVFVGRPAALAKGTSNELVALPLRPDVPQWTIARASVFQMQSTCRARPEPTLAVSQLPLGVPQTVRLRSVCRCRQKIESTVFRAPGLSHCRSKPAAAWCASDRLRLRSAPGEERRKDSCWPAALGPQG